MNTKAVTPLQISNPKVGAAITLAAACSALPGAENNSDDQIKELISALRNTDEGVSSAAVDSMPRHGGAAVEPLLSLMSDADFELARRAKRALWKVVRHVGRPGAGSEAVAVQDRLLEVLGTNVFCPKQVRSDLLWMLSEIGDAAAVGPIARLLANKELREDARCVLLRLPFPESLDALKSAFGVADDEFKYPLADALRARGHAVAGYPSRKMLATAQTTVKPLQKK